MLELLISQPWALDAKYHDAVHAVAVARMTAGKEPLYLSNKDRASNRIETKQFSGRVSGLNLAGNVRVIPLVGAMSRDGELCSLGTEQIGQFIKEANKDESIDAILLKINSPGGTVDGTEMLANIVRDSVKPVVAFVAGTAASAAYWVASMAREIVIESASTAYVGSIGVVSIHEDYSAALEKEGRKITIIRSDGSGNKMLFNPVEGLSDELIVQVKGELNVIRETFVNAIKSSRTDISEDVFDGTVLNGGDAIKKKMIDRVGDFDAALGRALFLARKEKLVNKSSNNNQQKTMSYMKLEAVLGGSLPEGFPEETALALEGVLVERDNRITALEAAEATATTRIAQLEAAENKLKAYTATNLSAEQVVVVNEWYESAKKVGATNAGDANFQPSGKKMSKATEAAAAVYKQLHGQAES